MMVKIRFKNYKSNILLTFLIGFIIFVNGAPYYFGDAYGYFHTAKTFATQGTFVTPIIPKYTPYASHGVVIRDDGMAVSVYPPGVSILWYPFLKVASFFDQGTIYTDYYKAFNGHSFADGFAVLIASGFYTFLAVVLLKKLLEVKGFSAKISYFAIAGAYISTYALSYLTQQAGYTHTYEIFAFAFFLYLIERFRIKQNKLYAIGAGLAASLLVAIRPADAVLFIPIAFVMFKYWRHTHWFVLGAIPILAVYMYYNFVSYGAVFASGYWVFGGQNFNFNQFRLWELLFSDFRGIIFWSPAMLCAFIALWKKYKDKWTFFVYGLSPMPVILAIAFWPYWWAGDSIGQRFFIVFVPVVALGLAYIFKNGTKPGKKIWIAITLITIIYSFFVAILYRFSPTPNLVDSNSTKAKYYSQLGVPPENLASPADMVSYHVSLVATSKSVTEYFNKFVSGFNQGRSLLLLAVGVTDPIVIIEKPEGNTFYVDTVPDTSRSNKHGDLIIFIKEKEYCIKFENLDFTKNNRILIDCNFGSCATSIKSELIGLIKVELPKKFVKISDRFDVWVEGGIKINFVNKKLPAY